MLRHLVLSTAAHTGSTDTMAQGEKTSKSFLVILTSLSSWNSSRCICHPVGIITMAQGRKTSPGFLVILILLMVHLPSCGDYLL